MTKYGFEIKLNNEKLCRMGLDVDYYVVSCNLTSMMREKDDEPEVSVHAGGLNGVNNNSVLWIDRVLKKGDQINIEIIDESFDEPAEITVSDSEAFLLEQKIKAFYRLKEELKDHLKE